MDGAGLPSTILPNSIFRKYPVLVTPQPLLARFRGDDDRVVGLMVVFGHMRIGRVVAAKRDTACLTDPEMQPFIACFYTFFTDICFGLLEFFDGRDMRTGWIGIHRICFKLPLNIYEQN